MSYTPGVPQATQRISETQVPIFNNFTVANTAFGTDHFAFNDASGPAPGGLQGYHKMTTFPTTAPASIPTPALNRGVIYTKTSGAQTIPYYRKDNVALDFPVIPIRAMGRFSIPAGPPPTPFNLTTVGTSFNVATAECTAWAGGGGSLQTIVITFTQALPDANYIVLIDTYSPTLSTNAVTAPITILNTGFTSNIELTLTAQFGFTVLHYL